MSALVTLEEVTVSYGQTTAANRLSLSVGSGDLLVLIGPDGAGKSTLSRLLVGLIRPDSGRIERSVGKEDLGYAGADFDLYVDLSVEENLRFFGGLRGMTHEELSAGIDRLLDLTGLVEARQRQAGRLSGGMRKKLSLATALLHDPQLLVLDEPTSGVDPVSRREVWDVVAEANARGAAVVYTSPYLDEATRARRIVLMNRGEVEEVSLDQLLGGEEGTRAWLIPVEMSRRRLRRLVADMDLGVRIYLRREGLTVLATDKEEAGRLARRVVPAGVGMPEPESVELTLDDAFILTEERWSR